MRYESPLEKWPGYVELPDLEDVLPAHWRDWREALSDVVGEQARDELAAGLLYQAHCVAGAVWIPKHGKWAIEGIQPEALATLAAAESVPLRLQAWLNRTLRDYWAAITDPKG